MNQALLVIDYIEAIAQSGTCADYLQANPHVIENTNQLIASYRNKQAPIFFVRLAFNKTYEGLPHYAPKGDYIQTHQKFLLDSHETDFIPELDYQSHDLVINKKYGDPFHGNTLVKQLKDLSIGHLIFTGVATDNAILFGTNTAMVNNFKVTVINDACGAATEDKHQQALAIMEGKSVNDICSTQTMIDLIK